MPSNLRTSPVSSPGLLSSPGTLTIESFSYEDRRVIFPAVFEALDLCGCWLLSHRQTSLTKVEFHFELQLRSVVEVYAALVASGLELSRASHHDLTMSCMVRKHREQPGKPAGVMTMLLVVKFLEDISPEILSMGSAYA